MVKGRHRDLVENYFCNELFTSHYSQLTIFHFTLLLFYAKIPDMNIINLNDTTNLYFVGGVVRDELLGLKSLDVDIVYEGNAIEDCSPLGELVRVNPDFGTIRVKIDGAEVDIASTRTECYERKGHLPQVDKIGCPLKEDVFRRDFTVNSLYKSLPTGEILDFVGGLDDLKNKTLRVLHDESFVDDPTRILRALKFSYRFGFKLDEKTRTLRENYLENVNYDMCYKRIKKELIETLRLNNDELFQEFIFAKIYKLVTDLEVALPTVSISPLVEKYAPNSENIWLIYIAILGDLSRLELTRKEQKILDDFKVLVAAELRNDFEIYKAFENAEIESIIIFAVLKNEKLARHYLDDLREIKIETTGKTLEELGIKPSPRYKEIFDFLLCEKLKNPSMTFADEIDLVVKSFI